MALLSLFQNVWWLLVLIGVMILIHELGHFWAARAFDVRVDVFSFGFGPRLFGFRRGETDYRFSLVLFGGYVKMAGEIPGEAPTEDPRAVLNKPRWQRLIITAAGPFMNVVLAVAVLTGLYMVSYEKIVDEDGAKIGHVMADSPAARAGIQAGDKIVRLDSNANPDWEDIVSKELTGADRPMTVTLERAGKPLTVSVTPELDPKQGVGSVGWEGQNQIQLGGVTDGTPAAKAGLKKGDLLLRIDGLPIHSMSTVPEVIRKSGGNPVTLEYSRAGQTRSVTMLPAFSNPDGTARWMIGVATSVKWNIQKTKLSFPDAMRQSLIQNGKSATMIFEFLRGMLERRMSAKNLEGPIGIAHEAKDAAEEGPSAFLTLMSIVSLNLAIVNMLPIPILDGAMILSLLIEMIMGRDISMGVKETALKVGFVFLMMLMVFVIYNDIARRFTPGLILPSVQMQR
jgi:regulator of sigma E protease